MTGTQQVFGFLINFRIVVFVPHHHAQGGASRLSLENAGENVHLVFFGPFSGRDFPIRFSFIKLGLDIFFS